MSGQQWSIEQVDEDFLNAQSSHGSDISSGLDQVFCRIFNEFILGYCISSCFALNETADDKDGQEGQHN